MPVEHSSRLSNSSGYLSINVITARRKTSCFGNGSGGNSRGGPDWRNAIGKRYRGRAFAGEMNQLVEAYEVGNGFPAVLTTRPFSNPHVRSHIWKETTAFPHADEKLSEKSESDIREFDRWKGKDRSGKHEASIK